MKYGSSGGPAYGGRHESTLTSHGGCDREIVIAGATQKTADPNGQAALAEQRGEIAATAAGKPVFDSTLVAALVAVLAGAALARAASPPKAAVTAPTKATFPLAASHQMLVLSIPAYLSDSVEDTPYQLMQLCDDAGKHCRTLLDVRGKGGVSVPEDKRLGFSPDGKFLICFRMAGVDAPGKSYRSQYYEIYDLGRGASVDFATRAGMAASTDDITGWADGQPHVLAVSVGFGKSDLAFPPDER